VVLEEGSLRRAAERLHVSQPSLTRQMQLLEHDLGGRVLERTSAGLRPTSEGLALAEKARALLGYYDSTVAEARKIVRGETQQLRIGYLTSAGREYLDPAVAVIRRRHPQVKIKMLDLATGEQIIALRRGEIDLALTALESCFRAIFTPARSLQCRAWSSFPSNHPLASEERISFSQLKNVALQRPTPVRALRAPPRPGG
jgi:DNA-binding transcriptional LysR family regulator